MSESVERFPLQPEAGSPAHDQSSSVGASAQRRCDCENAECRASHVMHTGESYPCKNLGTVKTIYSTICTECAQYMPAEYLQLGQEPTLVHQNAAKQQFLASMTYLHHAMCELEAKWNELEASGVNAPTAGYPFEQSFDDARAAFGAYMEHVRKEWSR